MRCPECRGKSSVIDSRAWLIEIRRRRRCQACGHRWTTIEASADSMLKMCTQCRASFPRTTRFFPRDITRPDGYFTYCKACVLDNKARKKRRDLRGAAA